MPSSYHIDPETITLASVRNSLETRRLIPSRQPLKIGLSENFKKLTDEGIDTLQQLIAALKTPARLTSVAKKTGIDASYLTLLKREANSYLPNPVKLAALPGVLGKAVDALEKAGIKTTKQLFDNADLLSTVSAPKEALKELLGLADLCRLFGVGPVFSRMLYDVGIVSVQTFVSHTPQEIVDIYERTSGKKADFSAEDIQFAMEVAQALDIKG